MAGVRIRGVTGLNTTGLVIGVTVVDGFCTNGAPRFDLRLARAGSVRLGRARGDLEASGRRLHAGNPCTRRATRWIQPPYRSTSASMAAGPPRRRPSTSFW